TSRSVGASTTRIGLSRSSTDCSTHSAADAWGSASTIVTARRPEATAARYTDEVVFPTPPFTAATTTITRIRYRLSPPGWSGDVAAGGCPAARARGRSG